MTQYEKCREQLQHAPRGWLVTVAAGFIGSNIVEELRRLGQSVGGGADFSCGHPRTPDPVRAPVCVDSPARMLRAGSRSSSRSALECVTMARFRLSCWR